MITRAGSALICALFVLSVFIPTSIPVSAVDTTLNSAATTAPTYKSIESGDEYWQGFQLRFDGSQIVADPASASAADRTFQVRAVSDGEVGGLIDEFTIDTNGTGVIDTSEMSGRVLIQYQGDNVYVNSGAGSLSAPNGGSATVEQSAWRVNPQTYSTTWSDPTVYQGEITKVTLSSNRNARTTVAISADQLSFEELSRLFSSDDFAENFANRSDEDVLILKADATHTYEVAATNLSPGVYTLTFAGTETTAEHTTTLEVKKGTKIAALERRENAGDLIDTSIACADCYLVAGGVEEGFVDLVHLRDTNGDGFVNLTINSRFIGLEPSAPGVPSDAEPYASTRDSVDRLSPSYRLTERDSQDQLGTLRTDLGLRAKGRTAPVMPGRVDLTVAASDFLMSRSQYGTHRAPLGGQLVARDEQDVSTIDLQKPALGTLETYGQPSSFGINRNLTAVSNRLPPTERVALGDELIIQVDIGGVYGYLDHAGWDLWTIADNQDEGLDLVIRRSNGRPGLQIDLSANSIDVDERNDRLYAAIDTSRQAIRKKIEVGATYQVSFTLRGVDERAGEYDVSGSEAQYTGYPYLAPGEMKRAHITVTFVKPSATLESTGDTLQVANRNPVKLQGTTTLAPGSVIAVSVEGPWSKSTTAMVQPGGTWTATFDFSNTKVGETFTVTAKKQETVLTKASGTVVSASTAPGSSTPGTPGASGPTTAVTSPATNNPSGTTTAAAKDSQVVNSPGEAPPENTGILGGVVGGTISQYLLPIAAIFGIFGLIAFVISRLR